MPEVQIDGRGRCTVTWLPNFLLWVVKHIVLPMGLRCARLARESSASILTFLAASFYSCSWSPLVFGGDQNIWCFTSDSEALVIKESQIDNNILSEISIRRVPSRTLQRRNRQCFGNLLYSNQQNQWNCSRQFSSGSCESFGWWMVVFFNPFIFKIGKSYSYYSCFQCHFKPCCWDLTCKNKFCSTPARIYKVNNFMSNDLVVTPHFFDRKSSNKVSSPRLW